MHTLLVCRNFGYSTHHGDYGECQKRFADACDDPKTLVAAWYDQQGNSVNSFANPTAFKH